MKNKLVVTGLLLMLPGCLKMGVSEYALSYPIEQCPRVAVRYIPEGCEHTTRALDSVHPPTRSQTPVTPSQ